MLDSLTISVETGTKLPLIIILDLQLPDMNGYQALKEIKGSGKLRRIPVVIHSSCQDLNAIQRCLEAGAMAFFDKPVRLDQLKNLFSRVSHNLDDVQVA